MFSILNEINNNSHFRTTSVVTTSIGSACFIYVLVAITGYLSFGNNVHDNIVSMCKCPCSLLPELIDLFCLDLPSAASTIAKAAIVVLVMFSYPLQVHPCRASVNAVLKWRFKSTGSPPSSPPSKNSAQHADVISDAKFAGITTVIIILSFIVAMTVSSLSSVLAYVGSTGSTSISFILPGLFYWKISAPESPHYQRMLKENDDEEEDGEHVTLLGTGIKVATGRAVLRKLSLALAMYGVIVMITCLVTTTVFHVSH